MFPPRVFMLCMIFYHCWGFTTAQAENLITCSNQSSTTYNATTANCLAALNMVSDGNLRPGPVRGQPSFFQKAFLRPICSTYPLCFGPAPAISSSIATLTSRGGRFIIVRTSRGLYTRQFGQSERDGEKIVDGCFPSSQTGFSLGEGSVPFEAVQRRKPEMSCWVIVEEHRPIPPRPLEAGDDSYLYYYQTNASGRIVRVSGKSE